MKIENILCPVDFSEPSDAAVAYASALADRYEAKLHFVYVYEPVPVGGDLEGVPSYPQPADVEPLRERLEALQPTSPKVDCCHELVLGFPGSSLLSYASSHKIDLIVMGTHGRTGATRLLMGSVAETVVRKAPCPVLTVHAKNGAVEG